MGMYDTVVIEGLKLPKPSEKITSFLKKSGKELSNDFQTKDLDNLLSTFTIDNKGQIFITEYKPTGKKVPFRPLNERWVDKRSFIERLYFNYKNKQLNIRYPNLSMVDERKPVTVKSNLTNTFKIYSYNEIAGRYVDVAYEIKAVDGKVKKIKFLEDDIESEKQATSRKKNNIEFETNLAKAFDKRKKFQSKWYYPVIRELYNPFVFFASKLVQFICNAIIKSSYNWRGV